jgi:hypothetical protein
MRTTASRRDIRVERLTDQGVTRQYLVEYRSGGSLLGRPTRSVLDTEIVPEDVMITLGCFGDTGGWKSKFARLIGAQQEFEQATSDLLGKLGLSGP